MVIYQHPSSSLHSLLDVMHVSVNDHLDHPKRSSFNAVLVQRPTTGSTAHSLFSPVEYFGISYRHTNLLLARMRQKKKVSRHLAILKCNNGTDEGKQGGTITLPQGLSCSTLMDTLNLLAVQICALKDVTRLSLLPTSLKIMPEMF